jgi:hypothetical protein
VRDTEDPIGGRFRWPDFEFELCSWSGPSEDIRDADIDDQDGDGDEESSLDDSMDEEKIVDMSITPLPSMRHRVKFDSNSSISQQAFCL